MIGQFAAFLGVSLLVIVTPGPDTALTVRNTLLGGRRRGIGTAAGVAGGQAIWAACTALGVAALLRASQPVFDALRVVGAGYLVYLGAQALIAALRGVSTHRATERGVRNTRIVVGVRQGLLSNLSNPKMVVFFLGLLPQFAGAHASFATLLGFGLVFCAITFCWLSAYAVAIAKAADFLQRTRIRRTLDALTGLVLVALGVRLLSEQP